MPTRPCKNRANKVEGGVPGKGGLPLLLPGRCLKRKSAKP